jgi:hypothetical protein
MHKVAPHPIKSSPGSSFSNVKLYLKTILKRTLQKLSSPTKKLSSPTKKLSSSTKKISSPTKKPPTKKPPTKKPPTKNNLLKGGQQQRGGSNNLQSFLTGFHK